MNLYCLPADLNNIAGAHQSADADLILDLIETASRWIDEIAQRHFYTVQGVRYFKSGNIDDVLAVTALGADSEGDATFDGEAWIEGTDYRLAPLNSWPKMRIETLPDGRYAMPCGYIIRPYFKLTGTFGYGDGDGADPWRALGVTGTVDTADGTTLTMSADGYLSAGMTIKAGDEQMAVVSVSGLNATVARGINGTTAAAHGGAAVSLALYPARIRLAAINKTLDFWHEFSKSGETASEWMGSYNYMRMTQAEANERDRRMVGPYIRMA